MAMREEERASVAAQMAVGKRVPAARPASRARRKLTGVQTVACGWGCARLPDACGGGGGARRLVVSPLVGQNDFAARHAVHCRAGHLRVLVLSILRQSGVARGGLGSPSSRRWAVARSSFGERGQARRPQTMATRTWLHRLPPLPPPPLHQPRRRTLRHCQTPVPPYQVRLATRLLGRPDATRRRRPPQCQPPCRHFHSLRRLPIRW
mmetsp:Transcript_5304/g.17073  ORF Transcript_5304/g.17073 Transcript_5304/m.17073 type:complete len:207 (-) Transcript_5304:118-738(-)